MLEFSDPGNQICESNSRMKQISLPRIPYEDLSFWHFKTPDRKKQSFCHTIGYGKIHLSIFACLVSHQSPDTRSMDVYLVGAARPTSILSPSLESTSEPCSLLASFPGEVFAPEITAALRWRSHSRLDAWILQHTLFFAEVILHHHLYLEPDPRHKMTEGREWCWDQTFSQGAKGNLGTWLSLFYHYSEDLPYSVWEVRNHVLQV